MLRGGIDRRAGLAYKAADRTHVDDVAAPVLAQIGQDVLRGEEHRPDVDSHHEVPIHVSAFQQRLHLHHACVVDDDREAAKCGNRLFDRGENVGAANHIARDRHGVASGIADVLRDGLAPFDAPPDERDLGALLGK